MGKPANLLVGYFPKKAVMAKKKKKIQETTIEDFYDLKIDKVDELVAALKGDSDASDDGVLSMNINDCTGVYDPKNIKRSGKQKQFNPYRTNFLGNVPVVLKALFVKWWFFALVSFFIVMGLGYYIADPLDLLVLTGLATGIVVDVLVNPVFRYMESDEHEYNKYMMFPFPFKAFWTFFTNIVYAIFITCCVGSIYEIINVIGNNISGTTGNSYFAIEPLSFGLIMLAVDMIFIGIKDGIAVLVLYLKKKHRLKKEEPLNV